MADYDLQPQDKGGRFCKKIYNKEQYTVPTAPQTAVEPSTSSLPYYPAKQWTKPYNAQYGARDQLSCDPDSMFDFVASPFDHTKTLPSPNILISTPTQSTLEASNEVISKHKIKEERLSPQRTVTQVIMGDDDEMSEFQIVKIS